MMLVDGGRTLGRSMERFKGEYFRESRWIKNPYGVSQCIEWEPLDGAQTRIMDRIGADCLSMRAVDKLPGLPDLLTVDHWIDMPAETRANTMRSDAPWCWRCPAVRMSRRRMRAY